VSRQAHLLPSVVAATRLASFEPVLKRELQKMQKKGVTLCCLKASSAFEKAPEFLYKFPLSLGRSLTVVK
jgi:hypothetical protein